MCVLYSKKRIRDGVRYKYDPDQGRALPQLQTGATWAFVPANLKVLKSVCGRSKYCRMHLAQSSRKIHWKPLVLWSRARSSSHNN